MGSTITLEYLLAHDVKPSLQRIAVMDYLLNHRTHPTVEEIYTALHPHIPTLSKTTVYNTLRLLVERKAALQLSIDEKKVCFDADTTPHAHFLCRCCGKVYDMKLHREGVDTIAEVGNGFQVEQVDVYLHGICPACQKKAN